MFVVGCGPGTRTAQGDKLVFKNVPGSAEKSAYWL